MSQENVTWDDPRIEQLKKLWSEGLSASQIAAELGGVTRNAVIGKVHRLGLSGRAKSKPAVAARPRAKVVKAPARTTTTVVARGNLATVEVMEMVPMALPQRENVVIPMARRISIMELREGVCRWPLGDPLQSDFAYCGADCSVGTTYCEAHSRMAYQPHNDRRRAS